MAAPLSTSASATATITAAPSLSSSASASASKSSASSSSSSKGPQVHTVKVGSGGFKYEPAALTNVSVGDTVTFEFYPPDHSVVRAEFGSACVPYEYTGKNKTGFWSDTRNVSSVENLQYWNLTINSTEPIFYYCAAPKSCTGQHMVGVINPNDTQTLDKQIQAASEASYQLKPGDPVPAEGSSSLTMTTSPTSTPTSTPNNTVTSHPHTLSGGAIAGIVVGAVAFLVICAALFFFVGRAKSLKEALNRNDATVAKSMPQDGGAYAPTSQPGSPGQPPAAFTPPTPFSPSQTYAEHGGQLPAYGQHHATDPHPGWSSPTMVPPHGSPQPQMVEVKEGEPPRVHELASPTPDQQTFELEGPPVNKAPR